MRRRCINSCESKESSQAEKVILPSRQYSGDCASASHSIFRRSAPPSFKRRPIGSGSAAFYKSRGAAPRKPSLLGEGGAKRRVMGRVMRRLSRSDTSANPLLKEGVAKRQEIECAAGA